MNRFDYLKYDEIAITRQANAKEAMMNLEMFIESSVASPRAKALALTKLEEAYMWIGKGIRDDQISRSSAPVIQEERVNS